MKRAILARFIGILILALIVSSVISYYFIGNRMMDNNINDMLKTINVIDYALEGTEELQGRLASLYNHALDDNTRVTIISMDGLVLADTSAARPELLENHLNREEIKKAVRTGTGYATRVSETVDENLLYVASASNNGAYIIRVAIPYTGILNYMLTIFPFLLLGTGIALIFSIVIAIRFTETITEPLKEISSVMSEIRGDKLNFHFKRYRYEELNIISDTTTKLAEEIGDYLQRLEKEKKIRQEFFSNASHELKTPITSVKGYAELLEHGFIRDETTRQDFYGRILRETDNMSTLIDDILMISRLEAKEAEVEFSMVKMNVLLDEVLESLEPIAHDYQIELQKECEPIVIEASTKQMRELLMNLITNGIKYNHPGGHVRVTVRRVGMAMEIRVKDDGVGIGAKDRERVFERFYRVDKGRSKKMGGTGLGLSIVKHIIEFYNGSIVLNSRIGEGSEFIAMIPFGKGCES